MFIAFATSGITFIKMLGVGMALAVIVDATLIRAALVPAFMRLAGSANWWAPGPPLRGASVRRKRCGRTRQATRRPRRGCGSRWRASSGPAASAVDCGLITLRQLCPASPRGCQGASRTPSLTQHRWSGRCHLARPKITVENVSHRFILPTVASTIDLVVFLASDGRGRRRVEEVLAVPGRVGQDQVEAGLVFRRFDGKLAWTGEYPPHAGRFRATGCDLVEVLGS